MNELVSLFEKAGNGLDSRWKEALYDADLFSEYAEAALRDIDKLATFDLDDIYRWIFTAPEIPRQHDLEARFSQPPLTVFMNERFHIGFLFWTTSTTSIHEHSFEGAFQVFHGSSVQTTYEFQQDVEVSEHFRTGALIPKDISFLRERDICRIDRGDSFIHSLYHLDHPSVTLIIRTNKTRAFRQFDYHRPGIAINPSFKPERLTRVRQFLSHLHEIQHPEFEKLASSCLSASDPYAQYQILQQLGALRPRLETERLSELAGSFSAIFKAALKENSRTHRLTAARKTVRDGGRRLFLALLLNVPTRSEVLRLLKLVGQPDPEEFIRQEVAQLCQDGTLGISDNALTGFIISKLLSCPLTEIDRCFENAALKPLADEIRFIFHPVFQSPELPGS